MGSVFGIYSIAALIIIYLLCVCYLCALCSCALSNSFCRQHSKLPSSLGPLLAAMIKSNLSCAYYIFSLPTGRPRGGRGVTACSLHLSLFPPKIHSVHFQQDVLYLFTRFSYHIGYVWCCLRKQVNMFEDGCSK